MLIRPSGVVIILLCPAAANATTATNVSAASTSAIRPKLFLTIFFLLPGSYFFAFTPAEREAKEPRLGVQHNESAKISRNCNRPMWSVKRGIARKSATGKDFKVPQKSHDLDYFASSGHFGEASSICHTGAPAASGPMDFRKIGTSALSTQMRVSGGCFPTSGATARATPPRFTFST
jgi:hypothetical protein